MGSTGAFMAMSSVSSIGTAYAQSQAIRSAGDYKATIAATNAKISDLQAEQTIEAGDAAASRRDLVTRANVGSIRAAQGSSGTDVNSGSNKLTQISADFSGKMDAMTIRNNASRRAWGFKTQAMNDTFEGQMTRMTAATQAQQTLLTGGLKAVEGPTSMYAKNLYYQRWLGGSGGASNKPYDASEWEGKV